MKVLFFALVVFFNSVDCRADYWGTPEVRTPEPTMYQYHEAAPRVRIDSNYGGSVEVRQGGDRMRCHENFGGSITCR